MKKLRRSSTRPALPLDSSYSVSVVLADEQELADAEFHPEPLAQYLHFAAPSRTTHFAVEWSVLS